MRKAGIEDYELFARKVPELVRAEAISFEVHDAKKCRQPHYWC
jgi:hypothetical protein